MWCRYMIDIGYFNKHVLASAGIVIREKGRMSLSAKSIVALACSMVGQDSRT